MRADEVSRPSLLFFTYYRVVPTAQMGIFKRCLRLIRHLAGDFDIHLVNYGPLPEEDALFSEIRPLIEIHDPGDGELGEALVAIFEAVRPAAVIHGEAPLRGSMRLSHRIASAFELWQICIDNYYGELLTSELVSGWPRIDRWLLLGLADGAPAVDSRVEIVPPFVRFPAAHGRAPRDRIVLLGYDKQTLFTGVRLLGRLPATEKVDIVIAPAWQPFLASLDLDLSRPGLRVLVLPGDEELYSSLSRARLVIGKAGFQQVVESIGMGAPILCQRCGGGIDAWLVPSHLQPFVRFVNGEEDLPGVLPDVAAWLLETPRSPWFDLASRVDDPAAHAARRLRNLIAETPARAASGRSGGAHPDPGAGRGLVKDLAGGDPALLFFRLPSLIALRSCVEGKDWTGLARLLDVPSVWAFDRLLPPVELVRLLEEGFSAAEDLQLLVSGVRHWENRGDEIRASLASCLMWGETGTWAEHEQELVLHLGTRLREDGSWRVSYLGFTATEAEEPPRPSRACHTTREISAIV